MKNKEIKTSERKIKKLFLKYLLWNKYEKANILLTNYTPIIMPWQKAFENASNSSDYSVCQWILRNSINYNVIVDIHFSQNEIIRKPCEMFFQSNIKQIIMWDINYPWIDELQTFLSNLPHKEEIINIIIKTQSTTQSPNTIT